MKDGIRIAWGHYTSVHSGDAYVHDIASGEMLLSIEFHGHAWIRLSKVKKKRLLKVVADALPTRNAKVMPHGLTGEKEPQ